MNTVRLMSVWVLVATGSLFAGCHTPKAGDAAAASAPVVLVCEHGSVKMAASL